MTLPRPVEGEVLKATDYLEGHVNCRCTLVPRAKSYADILGDPSIPDNRPPIIKGEEEFNQLDTNTKAAILGPGKYALWRAGAPLDAFVQRVEHPGFGASRVARPLRDVMAKLEKEGWQPGDWWPKSLDGFYSQQGYVQPVIPRPTPEPAGYVGPKPGEFKDEYEAEQWFKHEFPDIEIDIPRGGVGVGVDMDALNGTMEGFRIIKLEHPEGLTKLRAVRFRDLESDGLYAHAPGAIKDSSGRWVSNNSGYYPNGGDSMIEFNLRPKMYGSKGDTIQPLSVFDRYEFESQVRSKEWLDVLIHEADPDWTIDPDRWYLFKHDIAPKIIAKYPDRGFTIHGLGQDYRIRSMYERLLRDNRAITRLTDTEIEQAIKDKDAIRQYFARFKWGTDEGLDARYQGWGNLDRLLDWGQPSDIYNRIAASNPGLSFNAHELIEMAGKYAKIRDEMLFGRQAPKGLRPLWQSIQSDVKSGYHPDIGLPTSGDLTPAQQLQYIASIAVHEYGHIYDISYAQRIKGAIIEGLTDPHYWSDNLFRGLWMKVKESPQIGGVVSGYARKNSNEKFAEAFTAMVMQPKSKWVPYVKKVAKAIDFINRTASKVESTMTFRSGDVASIRIRFGHIEEMVRVNKDLGFKLFDVSADDIRDAPKILRLLDEGESKGVDDYWMEKIIQEARNEQAWDLDELVKWYRSRILGYVP